jgi:hypothetical protein
MKNPFSSKLKELYAMMLVLFGSKSLVKDGKLVMSDEQKQKFSEEYPKINLEKVTKAFNQELADMVDNLDEGTEAEQKDKKEKLMQ